MAESTHTFARNLEHTDWRAAVYAACIAAATFLVVQMLVAGLVFGYGPWLPVRMIGAIALGTRALAETGFPVVVTLVAFLLHLGLSIMTAFILAPVIQGMSLPRSWLVGAAGGVVIYLVNFHLMTGVFTWFAAIRGWSTLGSHVVFGIVLAGAYHGCRRRDSGPIR